MMFLYLSTLQTYRGTLAIKLNVVNYLSVSCAAVSRRDRGGAAACEHDSSLPAAAAGGL